MSSVAWCAGPDTLLHQGEHVFISVSGSDPKLGLKPFSQLQHVDYFPPEDENMIYKLN